MMNARSIIMTLAAVFCLFIMFITGYDIGRRNLVVDIDTYGCEKVIAKYHGTRK